MQFLHRAKRKIFRLSNKIINPYGLLLSRPEAIHGSPAFSGATLFSRRICNMRFFYNLIKDVDGDVIESGVHWGYGMLIHLQCANRKRKIYGFDSFAGHSEPHQKDFSGGSYQPLDDSFKVSEGDVWRTIALGTGKEKNEFNDSIELIHGWIQDTLPEFKKRARAEKIKLSFVHADCDIYEPFKATLENSWEALQVGGIISIGKLNNPELLGKTSAVNEFLKTLDHGAYEVKSFDIVDNGLIKSSSHYIHKLEH